MKIEDLNTKEKIEHLWKAIRFAIDDMEEHIKHNNYEMHDNFVVKSELIRFFEKIHSLRDPDPEIIAYWAKYYYAFAEDTIIYGNASNKLLSYLTFSEINAPIDENFDYYLSNKFYENVKTVFKHRQDELDEEEFRQMTKQEKLDTIFDYFEKISIEKLDNNPYGIGKAYKMTINNMIFNIISDRIPEDIGNYIDLITHENIYLTFIVRVLYKEYKINAYLTIGNKHEMFTLSKKESALLLGKI